jgi:hypothetical protein
MPRASPPLHRSPPDAGKNGYRAPMSHFRSYCLIPETAFARGLVDSSFQNRGERLLRHIRQPHHSIPLNWAVSLHRACQDALVELFSGVRLPRAQRAVDHLFFGDLPIHRSLRVPVTGDIPRGIHGTALAQAQEVLRALRPSRVPGLTDPLKPHHTRLRVLLNHVDPHQMRWVTFIDQ